MGIGMHQRIYLYLEGSTKKPGSGHFMIKKEGCLSNKEREIAIVLCVLVSRQRLDDGTASD